MNKNLLPFLGVLAIAILTALFVPGSVGKFTIGDALLWLVSPTGFFAILVGIVAAYFGWSANTTNIVAGIVLAAVGGAVQYIVGVIPVAYVNQQLLDALFVLFSALFGLGVVPAIHVKVTSHLAAQVGAAKMAAVYNK